MNDELSKKIQEQIDAENISPLPRWRFQLLRSAFWVLAALSVIIGSLAIATILFIFFDYSNHSIPKIPEDTTEFLLMIPYLWIIIFLSFIAISQTAIKHTKRGYQYRIHMVIIVSVLLSIFFGYILNLAGLGAITHNSLNKIQIYKSATYDSKAVYTRPKVGKLGGIIVSIVDNNNFTIQDFAGHVWRVELASTTNGFIPEASSTVRMSGILESSSSIFIAKSIHEWEK